MHTPHPPLLKIEAFTNRESVNGGAELTLHYHSTDSPFGRMCIAATSRGICTLLFEETPGEGLAILRGLFPRAHIEESSDTLFTNAAAYISGEDQENPTLTLHLKGTPFQLDVWNALLRIAPGDLTTYGAIAVQIERPSACRAVGTAIGANPVALLIPCHRVIQANGSIGNYRWGAARKRAIIDWEAKRRRA